MTKDRKKFKKIRFYYVLALLVFMMILSFGLPALAGLTAFNIANGDITISPSEDEGFDVEQEGITSPSRLTITVTGTSDTHKIILETGAVANVVINNLTITSGTCAFEVQGNAELNLTVVGANTLTSGANKAGLQVASEATLNIDGTGLLTATGGNFAAGIGGGRASDVGEINIDAEGTITATGGFNSAGIGGAFEASAGTINIIDGTIIATGGIGGEGGGGAGIGGGWNENGGTITISGGTITANGKDGSAGIGGGSEGDGGTITISNGTVSALSENGAGIGGGNLGDPAIVKIASAATIKAVSNNTDNGPIHAVGGALASESTAYILVANFSTEQALDTPTAVFASGSSDVTLSFTPNIAYKSMALSLPNTGAYNLKTGVLPVMQQQGTISPSIDFSVSELGLHEFDNVQDALAFDVSLGNITISEGSISGIKVTHSGGIESDNITFPINIVGTTTTNKVVVDDVEAEIVINNLNIQNNVTANFCAFELQGAADVALTLEGANTLKSSQGKAGLQVPATASLTILGTGSLTATGGSYDDTSLYGAGIGSEDGMDCGTININNGTIVAIGTNGAGIGGGDDGQGGTITLSGGTIIASSINGAGIGCGRGVVDGNAVITISNAANVKASSNSSSILAIDATGDALAAGSTANVLLAEFTESQTSAKTTAVISSNLSEYASFSPAVAYKSIAFSVPTGTYRLMAGNIFQQQGVATPSKSFAVSASGITMFENVESATPEGLATSDGSVSYTISSSAITIDNTLVMDGFTSNITGASVMVRNFVVGDVLTYPAQIGNISGSYNAANGVLSLSGNDTQANYQAAFRSIKFSTTATDTTARIIDFSIGSGLYFAGTGHFYEYIAGNINWPSAKNAATARSLYGRQGYLITITSLEESTFIKGKVSGTGWIGAQDINADVNIADWRWVTGPESLEDEGNGLAFWSGLYDGSVVEGMYSNWNNSEPNNSSSNETVGQMYADANNLGKWNDLPTTSNIAGYFIEYGGMPTDTPLSVTDNKTVVVSAQPTVNPTKSSSNTGVSVIVNGKEQNAGEKNTETINGVTTVSVAVNRDVILDKIQEAAGNATSTRNIIQVPVTESSADKVKVVLTGDIVKALEDSTFDVSVQSDGVGYTIPAREFTILNVAKNLGVAESSLKNIEVEVQITKVPAETKQKYEEIAKAQGAQLVFEPVEFDIICKVTNAAGESQNVSVAKFSNYVERVMEIPAGVDASQITTGIVFNTDGTYTHVPTKVYQENGKWYAKINSLTNSAYSVIYNPVVFIDTANHWANKTINEMGSRLVVSGVGNGNFEPNRDITRAEFATVVVRALGLMRSGSGEDVFSDVSAKAWYYDAVYIASEYGIVSGYGTGEFGPNDEISREQAMIMIARAMKLTGLETTLTESDITSVLSEYADVNKVAAYAKASIAACIENGIVSGRTENTIAPKNNITRAEVAVIIQRLLETSELI